MERMIWSDELSVFDKKIDEQHKKLIELVNAYADAVSARQEKAVLGKMLRHLMRYIEVHFQEEENMMQLARYPKQPEHSREHEQFVFKVAETVEAYQYGDFAVARDLRDFLITWVREHIMQIDREFGTYLRFRDTK